MSLPLLALVTLATLAIGYAVYSRIIARNFGLNADARTPAETVNDGVDYVPTKPFYLLGQHFSAIAAAGPIAGPILACQDFGWLPCILWIGLGVVFIGAVHDMSALVASVRHRARSIAEIVRDNLGSRAWLAMMAFIWLALEYVILAFTDITADTFLGKDEDLTGAATAFNRGGAVACSSTLYLLLAVVMGLVTKWWRPKLSILTAIFVPATLGIVWIGTQVSTSFVLHVEHPNRVWGLLILAYCFFASLTPVWALLQPRGYLGGFVLYMALAVGVVGIFFGGYSVQQPAFAGWHAVPARTDGSLFPFLFVTIACGACSGFHGLVCSGTTSKQLEKEPHARPVGYGGMLLEAFVALIALATIMIATRQDLFDTSGRKIGPGVVYGNGLGRFLSVILGEKNLRFAATFGLMAFSTFVFDTLDVSTRLGRYILQELFNARGRTGAVVATLLTLAFPVLLIAGSRPGAWRDYWTLFGTSNQLLAALTLLAITVWLWRSGRRIRYTLLPMLFVLTITVWSLAVQARTGLLALSEPGEASRIRVMNGIVALVLLGLAAALVLESIVAIRRRPVTESAGPG